MQLHQTVLPLIPSRVLRLPVIAGIRSCFEAAWRQVVDHGFRIVDVDQIADSNARAIDRIISRRSLRIADLYAAIVAYRRWLDAIAVTLARRAVAALARSAHSRSAGALMVTDLDGRIQRAAGCADRGPVGLFSFPVAVNPNVARAAIYRCGRDGRRNVGRRHTSVGTTRVELHRLLVLLVVVGKFASEIEFRLEIRLPVLGILIEVPPAVAAVLVAIAVLLIC